MHEYRFPTEEQRIANARKAVENGKKNKEEKVLIDLRQHFRAMRRGKPA